jgi:hypothetical protein
MNTFSTESAIITLAEFYRDHGGDSDHVIAIPVQFTASTELDRGDTTEQVQIEYLLWIVFHFAGHVKVGYLIFGSPSECIQKGCDVGDPKLLSCWHRSANHDSAWRTDGVEIPLQDLKKRISKDFQSKFGTTAYVVYGRFASAYHVEMIKGRLLTHCDGLSLILNLEK